MGWRQRNARENARLGVVGFCLAMALLVIFYHDVRSFTEKFWPRQDERHQVAETPLSRVYHPVDSTKGYVVLVATEDTAYWPECEERDMGTTVASWYGEPYHGRVMANGQTYDMHKMTCAHKTLPLGSIIIFERNGITAICELTDRGPYIPGRTWDVSYACACSLGMVDEGVVAVKATALIIK